MGDTYTMDAPVVREIQGLVGELTDDEAALVRTLTPPDLAPTAVVEHLFDLVDLLATIRYDEAVADYVYAIAPDWDGSIETLLLGGRVTTAFNRYELEQRMHAPRSPRAARRRAAFPSGSAEPAARRSGTAPARGLSPGARCGRATTRARPLRPASAGRARRPTGGPAHPHRRARPPRSRRPVPGRPRPGRR